MPSVAVVAVSKTIYSSLGTRVQAKMDWLGVKFGNAELRSANAILLRAPRSLGEAFSPGTP
jgi:hypothetical protein